MGEAADDIEEHIDHTRHELQANLEELEMRVKDMANWRSMVRKHPGAMVVAAPAGGMLLAAIVGRR